MMHMTITLSLLTAVAALITGGCETSNQNYSSSRVVDATNVSAVQSVPGSARAPVTAGTVSRTVSRTAGPEILSDAPIYDAPVYDAGLSPASQGSQATQAPVQAPVQAQAPAAAPGTLIGGVPDEPMPQYQSSSAVSAPNAALPPDPLDDFNPSPVTQPVAAPRTQPVAAPRTQPVAQPVAQPGAAPTAQASSSSGNWLLVDSAEAQEDVNNTALEQKVLAQQAVSDSARTVYQNKLATTAGPDRYAVVKGDTLYSIAFRYGLDYHALANINKIDPPYNLSVGQVLVLNLKAQEAPSYVVQKGDTLYSIARKNGQSVSFLAGVNDLEPPYNLKVGQKILLSRDNSVSASSAASASKSENVVPVAGQKNPTTATPSKATASNNKGSSATQASSSSASSSANATTPIVKTATRKVAGVTWSWPTTGRVIEQFSTAEQGNKGVDIAGKRGQSIIAAADGQVVYSGNALRGFGNLIIINHTNEYLSAYAHNDVLLVKEGQKVKRGQQIARMGSTDTSSPRLHFEIRYRGQSVNPVSYLPK